MRYVLLFVETDKFQRDLEAMRQADRDRAYALVGRWFADNAHKIRGDKLRSAYTATTVRLEPAMSQSRPTARSSGAKRSSAATPRWTSPTSRRQYGWSAHGLAVQSWRYAHWSHEPDQPPTRLSRSRRPLRTSSHASCGSIPGGWRPHSSESPVTSPRPRTSSRTPSGRRCLDRPSKAFPSAPTQGCSPSPATAGSTFSAAKDEARSGAPSLCTTLAGVRSCASSTSKRKRLDGK